MIEELTKMTVSELSEGLRNQLFTSEEVVVSYLTKISKKEKTIQAYLQICEDRAIRKAKEIDLRRSKGETLSPLAGIPLGIKDNICTKDMRTTCASRFLANYYPAYDATVVTRLRNQDGIILGKLNMDEFAIGATTENSAFQITSNPVNEEYSPGGSSGGSAAAVASEEAPYSLGSDTGGSIRQPAASCGLVGIKPTYGAVSKYGLVAYASSLDQIGPITKSVQDAALIMNYLVGKDSKDASAASFQYPNFLTFLGRDLRNIKIGYCEEFFDYEIEKDVKEAILNAMKVYEGLGATMVSLSLPSLDYGLSAYEVISSAEAASNLSRFDGIGYGVRAIGSSNVDELYTASRGQGFGKSVKSRILFGMHMLTEENYHKYYNKALIARKKIRGELLQALSQCHAIIGPVTPTTAYKLRDKESNPGKIIEGDRYTVLANLAGIPAITLPCGKDHKGLPIGLQLMGAPFSEASLFQIAYAYEQEHQVGGGKHEL